MANTPKPAAPTIFEATASFYLGGTYVHEGATVAAGHPLMAGREHLFRPFAPTFAHTPARESASAEPRVHVTPAIEQASAAPGEKRGG